MSIMLTIEVEIHDREAVDNACTRLGIAKSKVGKVRLWQKEMEGVYVHLDGWKYPIVLDLKGRKLHYDNNENNPRWGDIKKLDAFKQAYSIEKIKLEARKKGQTATEKTLANKTVVITIA